MNALGITRAQLAGWARQCGMKLVPDPIVDDMDNDAVTLARVDDRAKVPDGSSVVYFIQEDGAGAIKIGTSKHLKKRMDEIARILPSEIVLLATIEGGHEVEWVIQQRFNHAHVKGEWFRPVPELLEYIAKVKTAP
jgi:Meiotically Up-regulated Gene 113 (MUG113) protein